MLPSAHLIVAGMELGALVLELEKAHSMAVVPLGQSSAPNLEKTVATNWAKEFVVEQCDEAFLLLHRIGRRYFEHSVQFRVDLLE
jgi:hypothetical protein